MKTFLLKRISVTLSVLLFITNCVLAHSPETNFWKERSKKIEVAALPLNFQLPPPLTQTLSSSISKQITKEIPGGMF